MPKSRAKSKRAAPRKPAAVRRGAPEFEVFAVRADDIGAAENAAKRLGGAWRVVAVPNLPGEFQLVPSGARGPSAGAAWEKARSLARQPGVHEAEPMFRHAGLEPDPELIDELLAPHERPVRTRRASGGSSKPLPCAATNAQWSVQAVRADVMWPSSTGKGIRVAHPDTGYTQHPEIFDAAANRVLASLGFDFVDNRNDPLDPMSGEHPGHGTATASVIMSARGGPQGRFVEGTAPETEIVPLRVSDSVIHFSFKNVALAIGHAVAARANIISMSLGGVFPSRALERAVLHARDQGVVLISAAGNQWPFVVYPAKYPDVLAVAASNCQSKKWSGSASGSAVDCTAPGESVWRARAERKNGATTFDIAPSSGTSYATATTAGICALWMAKHGYQNLLTRYGARLAAAFRKIVVEQGCDTPAGWDTRNMGAGIVNAKKILEAALPATVTTVRSRAPRSTMEIAVDYFPDLDPDLALSAIAGGVRRSGGRSVRSAFADAGDELLFQLGTNAQLRALIHARARPTRRRSAVRAAPALDASPTFHRAFGL